MRNFANKKLARLNKIQNKIFIPFIILMLVIGALTTYVMTDLVLSNAETSIDNKLKSDARLIQKFISDMEKSLAFYAQFIADTEKLAGHISEARDSRLILIYVLDFLRENKISSDIGGSRASFDNSSDLNRMGMLGIRTTGLLARQQGEQIKLSLSAVAPIERRMSSRSVVTVSREINREFLQELAEKTGAHKVHIYYGGKFIESSSSDDQCDINVREFLTPEIIDSALKSDEPLVETFSCSEHSFKVTFVPLVINFKKKALIGIFESMDDLVEARTNIILSTIVVVGLMFLIIVPIYVFTVSYTVAPIRELSEASRAVAEGHLDRYVPVRTGDEVGELSASFNSMVSDLKRYREDLEQWNQTLEQRVAARSQELAETQAQLIQSTKLAAVGELAAGIAHELNNPLAGIYAFLQVFVQTLRSRSLKELSEEEALGFQENLVHVEREIRRCKSIIGSLLTFARVSEKQYGPIQLNRIIEDTLSFMRNNLAKSGVTLETRFEEDLPPITGDANELQQVFLNMIVNARKAMSDSGRLTIATWVSKDENLVCASVADTGTGIEPEMLGKIFDPFFSTSKPGEGTGLGLSISYGIVKDHGGKIGVDSRPGQGATFTISFPFAGEPDQGGPPVSQEPVVSNTGSDIEAD